MPQEGDSVAFSGNPSDRERRLLALEDKYIGIILYKCRKILRNEQDAEEVAYDSLYELIIELDLKGEVGNTEAVARRITRNNCLDRLARDKKYRQLFLSYFIDPDDVSMIGDQLLDTENIAIAKLMANAAMKTPGLTDKQREVLNHYRMGLTVSEIARIMGVDSKTVREHFAAAIRKVRVWWGIVIVVVILVVGAFGKYF